MYKAVKEWGGRADTPRLRVVWCNFFPPAFYASTCMWGCEALSGHASGDRWRSFLSDRVSRCHTHVRLFPQPPPSEHVNNFVFSKGARRRSNPDCRRAQAHFQLRRRPTRRYISNTHLRTQVIGVKTTGCFDECDECDECDEWTVGWFACMNYLPVLLSWSAVQPCHAAHI